MISIGILGGIASGKSTVTKYLVEHGACHLDGDKINHEVLNYPEIVQQIVARHGTEVLYEDVSKYIPPKIDRKKLANIVFNSPSELKILEDIVWPLTNAKFHESFVRYNQNHTKVLILDIPMLIETGWVTLCDKIIYIACPEELRIKRFAKRQRYSIEEATEQLRNREKRQTDLNQKRDIADYVIENNSERDLLPNQLDENLNKQLEKIGIDLGLLPSLKQIKELEKKDRERHVENMKALDTATKLIAKYEPQFRPITDRCEGIEPLMEDFKVKELDKGKFSVNPFMPEHFIQDQ